MKHPGQDVRKRMEALSLVPESDERTIYGEPGRSGNFRAVILDRDGVIIEDRDPIHFKHEPRIIDGAKEAIEGFRSLGFRIAVATNQGAIGMGLIEHSHLISTMEYIRNTMSPLEPWDLAYYSPFFPGSIIPEYDVDHLDRKPGPGMILRAAHDLDLDLGSSIMIGDHLKDILAAHTAGCKGILVTTGRGNSQIETMINEGIGHGDPRYPDAIVQDISSAFYLMKEGFR